MPQRSKFLPTLLLWAVCLALPLVFFAGRTVQAATTVADLLPVKKLRVAFCAAYPPFESRNEKTGEFEGFDIDLAKALGERLGVPVELHDVEWPGLIAGLNKGDFDVIISCMSKSETRGQNVSMSDVYYNLSDVIVVRKGETGVASAADLRGKTVGVQLGSSAELALDALPGIGDIRRYNYNPEAFLDLANKRIDALVVGQAYAVVQMQKATGVFHVVGPLGDSAEVVMVLRKDNVALTEILNAALADLRKDGSLGRLEETHLRVQE